MEEYIIQYVNDILTDNYDIYHINNGEVINYEEILTNNNNNRSYLKYVIIPRSLSNVMNKNLREFFINVINDDVSIYKIDKKFIKGEKIALNIILNEISIINKFKEWKSKYIQNDINDYIFFWHLWFAKIQVCRNSLKLTFSEFQSSEYWDKYSLESLFDFMNIPMLFDLPIVIV